MKQITLVINSVLIGILLLSLTSQTSYAGTLKDIIQRKRRASPAENQILAETMFKYSDFDFDGGLTVPEMTVFFEKGLGLDKKMSKLMAIASLVKGDVNLDRKLQYPEVYDLMSSYNL